MSGLSKYAAGARVELVGDIRSNVEHGMKLINRKAFTRIGEKIIERAIGSVRRGSKNAKYSLPGNPVKTHTGNYKRRQNYKKTVFDTKVSVGPKLLGRGMGKGGKRKDGQRPSKNIPALMEYGGSVTAPKPTIILAKNTDIRYRRREVIKQNKERKARSRKSGKPFKRVTMSNLKWVKIPKGTRQIKPRPTMRLAFNKTLKSGVLKSSYARVGLGTIRMRDTRRKRISTRRRKR